MQIHFSTVTFTYTMLTILLGTATTSPIPWPEEKLEEINALRAEGVSEVVMLPLVMTQLNPNLMHSSR